jgi:RHS repeat-associated protein
VATDVKGNITTLPVNLRPTGATTAMNLNWDSDNKLRSADIDANGTADVNFQYDALGRRVARTGTGGSVVYVQMDQQTIADYPVGGAATTPTFRYVYASYIDEPVVRKTAGTGGTLVYFHRNHQYSVTAITTSTGAIAERYAYTAYGQPTVLDPSGTVLQASNFSLRYSFTGREWDATLGLHHFRARWMSPSAGRFITRDPIESDENLYEYCWGRSLWLVDPTGNTPLILPALPAVLPVAGGALVLTAAEQAAAAFGISVLACLATPACVDLMKQNMQVIVNGMSGAAKLALETACRAAWAVYKALGDSCGRCDKRPLCWPLSWARCLASAKSLACFKATAALRAGYFMSGCEFVIPTRVNHPGAVIQTLQAAENCAKSVENNCFGEIEV